MQQKPPYTASAAMFTPPHLVPSPLTSRYTEVPQQFSYNDASIRLRIMTLISSMAPSAHPDSLAIVITYICDILTRLHRTDQLGPRGIQSTEDVFIGIAYEKTDCYMGLIVNAPGAVAVKSFFEGDRMDISTKMDMEPEVAIEELRNRLVAKVNRKYEEIRAIKTAQRRW